MKRRRKLLEIAAESPASGARFVRRIHGTPAFLIDNEYLAHLAKILPTTKTLAMTDTVSRVVILSSLCVSFWLKKTVSFIYSPK
jgi:hypothetical protein